MNRLDRELPSSYTHTQNKNINENHFNLDTEIINLRDDILNTLTTDLDFNSFGNFICKRIQQIIPSAYVSLCCIEKEKMIPWAAPDIDSGYSSAYAGLKIGPAVGSCGSAAYLKQPVIVEDIETNPLWKNYKAIALPYGLKACCSYPIQDKERNVAATFAFYFADKIDIEVDILLKIAEAAIEFCLLAIEKENNRKSIKNLKFFDQLTGLPNRNHLLHHMDQYCKEDHTVYMIDIDHFKDINILLGYTLGDRVLKILADRLNKKIEHEFFLSRLERDIFVMVIPNVSYLKADSIAQKVNFWINQEISIQEHSLFLTASIGITQYHSLNKTMWLSECKSALYRVKQNNGNDYATFSKRIAEEEKERLYLSHLLKKYLNNNNLEVFYQPQIHLDDKNLYGLEALTRFYDDSHGEYISPNKFIPIAEETGQIDKLSYWLIDQVCQQLDVWDKKNIYVPKVSINLSASNFYNPDLGLYIQLLLEKYALAGSRLTIEITENAMISLSDTMLNNISIIKALGIHLSIDDFGTGYSSLSNLINLPVNEIKIDRSFVLKSHQDPKFITLISTIINLAKNLNLIVVAEGVENIEHYQMLKKHHCNIIQGYYYAKPMPPKAIELWLKNRETLI